MKLLRRISPLALLPVLALPAAMASTSAHAELSANVGVMSKYILRGIVEENGGTTVTGSLDWKSDSGFYAGWWVGNLGYSYDKDAGIDAYSTKGFENDLYAGYAGSIGDFNYHVGLLQFYYINVDDSSLPELVLGAGYGPLSIQAQYLLRDGWWGNSGDTYLTLNYGTSLTPRLDFSASLGYYLYDDDDVGNTKASFVTTEDSAFRHLNLTLTTPIADTGADFSFTYIIAGDDRGGNSYDDTIVIGMNYAFDM